MNNLDNITFHVEPQIGNAHLESLQGSKEYNSTMTNDRTTLQLFEDYIGISNLV